MTIEATDPAGTPLVLEQKRMRSAAASERETLLEARRAFERGEDDAALEHLERLVERGLRYADVFYMIGMVHERNERLDEALPELREAVRINPGYVEAQLALASLYERRGNFDLSREHAERASQLALHDEGGLDRTTRGKLANQQAVLADALAHAGERREAIDQYRRALDRCPEFHDIRHRLGVILRESGLPHQALREFQRILQAHPRMLESQIQLGLTYYSLGRTPEAVAEWEEALACDPGRDEARMYLRLVRAQPTPSAPGTVSVGADAPLSEGWDRRPLSASPETPEAPGTKDVAHAARTLDGPAGSWP